MGSSGFGRFGDYPGSGSFSGLGRIGGQGNSGEYNSEADCPVTIDFIILEDVATSEYYTTRHELPMQGEIVELKNALHEGRLVVISSSTREIIGNLPTRYNYLYYCVESGMHYSGNVLSSGERPMPYVTVDLHA